MKLLKDTLRYLFTMETLGMEYFYGVALVGEVSMLSYRFGVLHCLCDYL